MKWFSISFIILLPVIMAAFCFREKRRGRFFIFDPMVALFAGWLVIYFVQPLRYWDTLASWHDEWVLLKTSMLSVASLLTIIAGYYSKIGLKMVRRLPPVVYEFRRQRLLAISIGLICISLIAYLIVFKASGGVALWLSSPRGGTNYENVSGYLASLMTLLPLGVILFLFYSRWFGNTATRLVAYVLCSFNYLWFFYLGTRSRTILLAGSVLYVLSVTGKKFNLLLLVVIGLFLYVQTDFLASHRQYFFDLDFHVEEWKIEDFVANFKGSGEKQASRGMEYNCVLTAVDLVPEVVDYNYGYALLEFFTRPIPRKLWPSKRYPHYEAFTPIYEKGRLSTHWIKYAEVPILAGPAFTFIGHWFAVGGLPVLLLAAYLTGIGMSVIRWFIEMNRYSKPAILLYANLFMIGCGEVIGTPLFFIFSIWMPFLSVFVLCIALRKKGANLCKLNDLVVSIVYKPGVNSG